MVPQRSNHGDIWSGTYFEGINFWYSERRYFKTWFSRKGNKQLGSNVVSCFTEDSKGNVWKVLEDLGVNKLDKSTGIVPKYSSNASSNGLNYKNVHNIIFADYDVLWIATYIRRYKYFNHKNRKIPKRVF